MSLLSRAIKKANQKQVRARAPDVEQEASAIADIVRLWHWPRGASKTAPQAISQSLRAYKNWLQRLTTAPLDGRLERFRHNLLILLPAPRDYVLGYYERLFASVTKRNVKHIDRLYVWTPEDKEFNADGMDLAVAWCGEPELWDQLLKAI